jgi:Yip1 domain
VNLIQRVPEILLTPEDTWPHIEQESATAATIYKKYVAILAVIPALASGVSRPLLDLSAFSARLKLPFVAGLVNMVVVYALALTMVFLVARVINALAPTFGGVKDQVNALKLSAYAFTPAFIGGIFLLLPGLSLLGLPAALYALYLIYLGLPVLMKCPLDEVVGYAVVVISCVVAMVLGGIMLSLLWQPVASVVTAQPGTPKSQPQQPKSSVKTSEIKVDAPKVRESAKSVEKSLEQTKPTPVSASAPTAEPAPKPEAQKAPKIHGPLSPQELKSLLPYRIGTLQREFVEAQGGQAIGIPRSFAKATYMAGNQRVDLSITDMAELGGLAATTIWAQTTLDQQSSEKTEKIYMQGPRRVREVLRQDQRNSQISVLLSNGVMVEIKSQGLDSASLKAALASVNLDYIETMKQSEKKP